MDLSHLDAEGRATMVDVSGKPRVRRTARAAGSILTTGGTGLSPRDITPEITRGFCDRETPGIAEALRAQSYAETPAAMLSRGYAGLKESCLVVNFPGSVKAVRRCMEVLGPVLDHALRMIRGEGH